MSTVLLNGQGGPSVPRMADPGGPPLSTTVTCSQSWLSGARTLANSGRERGGRGGENEIEDRDSDGRR